MKRYLVFAYDNMYPSGGMNDFRFSFDSKDKAVEMSNIIGVKHYDYIQLFDSVTNLSWDYNNNDFPSESEEAFNEGFKEAIFKFIDRSLEDY